jgi:hypothetical protein
LDIPGAPKMILEVSQNKQNDNCNVDILAKEIESWKDLRYALREESALLFSKTLSECRQNKDYIRGLAPEVNTIQLYRYLCS